MNPMMMGMQGMQGMQPMMMNPMMGMNPMMVMNPMMGMGMPTMAPTAAASDPAAVAVETAKTIDPRIKRLCNDFRCDEKTTQQLQEVMLSREDFDEDLQALQLVMERDVSKGRKPSEALRTHIRNLKTNRFHGKDLLNPEIWNLACKYDLDDRVLNKLMTTLKAREATRKEDLAKLTERLGKCESKPHGPGLLMSLLQGLEDTGRLPSPPRYLGGSGRPHAAPLPG